MSQKKRTTVNGVNRVEEILRAEADGILAIPKDNPYAEVVKALHRSHKKHGKIIVTGVGKAGDVGRKIVSTFNSTGLSAVFLSPLDARHGDLGVVGKHDVLFLISNSGKTSEIVELVTLVEKMHPEINTVSLTSTKNSPLAQASDYALVTGCTSEVCPLGLTPTTSVLTMLAVADVLTVLSMEARRYTPKEYHLRHHSGYLGKKAKTMAKKQSSKQ